MELIEIFLFGPFASQMHIATNFIRTAINFYSETPIKVTNLFFSLKCFKKGKMELLV